MKRTTNPTILFASAIILIALGSVFIPQWINSAYFKGNNLSTPNTMFTAGEQLLYWGAVLTFIGTSILALASLIQNDRLHKRNIEIENENKNVQLLLAQEYIPFLKMNNFIITSITKESMDSIPSTVISSSTQRNGLIQYSITLISENVDIENAYKISSSFTLKNESKSILGKFIFTSATIEREIKSNQFRLDKKIIIPEMEINANQIILPDTIINFNLNIYCPKNIAKKDLLNINLHIESTTITGITFLEDINVQGIKNIIKPKYNIVQKQQN